jgi:hypothetical protein
MTVSINWQGGGSAVIDSIDADHIELVSTRAFAPGSRPEGNIALAPDSPSGAAARADGQSIWMKVHGARRQDDGTFRVKGRLLNVRRALLDLLKEVVSSANGGKSSTS